jgi:hypothetical protein
MEIAFPSRQNVDFTGLSGVLDVSYLGPKIRVIVRDKEQSLCAIREYLQQHQLTDVCIREVKPSMEDIFVGLAEGGVERWNTQ